MALTLASALVVIGVSARYPDTLLYHYCLQRSWGQGYIFTGICDSVHRGACMAGGVGGHVWLGACMARGRGMYGRGGMCGRGACVAGRVHGRGVHGGGRVCMARGSGMHGWGCVLGASMAGRHAMQGACMAGGNVWQGACMAGGVWVAGGVHGGGMHGQGAWQGGTCMVGMTCMPPGQIPRLWHMVNERAVRILLECILVLEIRRRQKEFQDYDCQKISRAIKASRFSKEFCFKWKIVMILNFSVSNVIHVAQLH